MPAYVTLPVLEKFKPSELPTDHGPRVASDRTIDCAAWYHVSRSASKRTNETVEFCAGKMGAPPERTRLFLAHLCAGELTQELSLPGVVSTTGHSTHALMPATAPCGRCAAALGDGPCTAFREGTESDCRSRRLVDGRYRDHWNATNCELKAQGFGELAQSMVTSQHRALCTGEEDVGCRVHDHWLAPAEVHESLSAARSRQTVTLLLRKDVAAPYQVAINVLFPGNRLGEHTMTVVAL